MRQIVILGGGKIGSLIATLLVESGGFEVFLGDMDPEVVAQLKKEIAHEQFQVSSIDVQDSKALGKFIESVRPEGIISSLPYYCNQAVGERARACGAHYFDLTEDVEVTRGIKVLSEKASSAFVPQCGLAPGFISIVAHGVEIFADVVDGWIDQ
jgi:saccharopine dehydrogenase-like NADP-dependent oxidoreductase